MYLTARSAAAIRYCFALLIFASLLLCVASAAPQNAAIKAFVSLPIIAAQRQPTVFGAYIGGAPWFPDRIDKFTNLVGAAPRIVMWYQHWGTSSSRQFDPNLVNAVVERGATPMITWEPKRADTGPLQPEYALRTIIAGQHDQYIREWAQGIAAWGGTLYLRFAHEMNGNWYPWSVGVNGNTSAEYISAWRHIVDIFRQEGATNVRWVWSPNIASGGASDRFAEVYPGDDYVDWVALDGYNWGATMLWSSWQTLATIFGPSYDALAALTTKPMMIAETASTESGGDKANWIRQGLLEDVPARLPRIQVVIWFHHEDQMNWQLDSSSSSLEAYREVIATSAYPAPLPLP